MTNIRRSTACRVRQWSAGAGLAAAAAAMIGVGTAHADTPDDVIGQAITDLNQADTLLDTASTADLSDLSMHLLSAQESVAPIAAGLPALESMQDQLSATDQTFVAGVDEQLVSAAQNVLSADQAIVVADQAGDLSSNSLQTVDITAIVADLQLIGAGFDVAGADFLADLTGGLGTTSADLASSLDPAAAVDPLIFADLLSSFGL